MEDRSFQQGERCFSSGVEPVPGICISTILPNRESVKKGSDGQNRGFDSSLANTNLVSSNIINVCSGSRTNSIVSESASQSRRQESPSGLKSNLTTSGLYSVRSKLEAEGISKQASSLITAARRNGTTTYYESAWRKWCSWCYERQVDPISAPINRILDFFAKSFEDGL